MWLTTCKNVDLIELPSFALTQHTAFGLDENAVKMRSGFETDAPERTVGVPGLPHRHCNTLGYG